MPSAHALAVRAVTGGRGAAYLADADRLLAYGAFTRRLGLGTHRGSRVAGYTWSRPPPAPDSSGGDAYPSAVPRGPAGYEVIPDDPAWPFIAELPRPRAASRYPGPSRSARSIFVLSST